MADAIAAGAIAPAIKPLFMQCPRCWGGGHELNAPAAACLGCGGGGRTADSFLAPHFLLSEFLASQTAIRRGIPNDPGSGVLAALHELAVFIEPVRLDVGPLHVDSGYRSMSLNLAVGGVADSAHVTGFAADLVPVLVSKRALFDRIANGGAPFDQVIWEFGSWIHIGVRGPNNLQRGQQLMIFPGTGYLPFNAADPRVVG